VFVAGEGEVCLMRININDRVDKINNISIVVIVNAKFYFFIN
jgi:hypothetical protein